MKLVGILLLLIGAVFALIYVAAWIVLLREHGAAEGVRIGFTLWPGNVVGFAILFLAVAFGGSGGLMLIRKDSSG
jgi:hypothetical protein